MKLKWETPGPVASAFMKSEKFVRGLRGPVGAGKSVTCCIEIFRKSAAQAPNKAGIRKTRWAIVRNTNPQLKTTTIKTWRDWFDDSYGKMQWSPPYTHNISVVLPDKTLMEAEIIFLALDKPEDVKRLLSLELTGVWINEARELSKTIVDACTMRVGRFPAVKDGGPSWYGVIMDTNAPDEEHWWAIMSGEVPAPEYMTQEEKLMLVKPDDWAFFSQGGAMKEKIGQDGSLIGYELNEERENANNLVPTYYDTTITGKSRQWIRVYVLNQYQSLSDGKPVYPTFRAEAHVAKAPVELLDSADVVVGIDFGRTPAAIVGQQVHSGRWVITHEILAKDMGAQRFAQYLLRELSRAGVTKEHTLRFYGDPAGSHMPQTDEKSPFMIFRQAGIPVIAAPSNDPEVRIEAVEQCLNRMVDGDPCLLLSPTCITLKAGFEGGYQFRKKMVGGSHDMFEDRPLKNHYSHAHDALQYLLLGGGEGRRVLTGQTRATKVSYARKGGFNPFDKKVVRRHQRASKVSWR